MTRIETIMLLTRNMALAKEELERSLIAIQIIDLLKAEQTEDYLKGYYEGR